MNGKWPKVMLLGALTSLWLLYDIVTTTEAPRLELAFPQYSLLACALIALVGSAMMYAADS